MPKLTHKIFIPLAFSLLFLAGKFVLAAPDNIINYQGKLTNNLDAAVADGNYDFTLTIWDAASGGNCVWSARGTCGTPTAKSVAVSKGIFSTALGEASDNAITLDFNSNYYLQVKVGTDSPMDVRRQITASGFAVNSSRLNGQLASYYLDTSAAGQTKSGALTVQGNITVGDSNSDYLIVYGGNSSGDIRSSSGALNLTPNSGSNLNVNLATTGDFAVNTSQLYVDTSAGNVGIGTTDPGANKLAISGDSTGRISQWIGNDNATSKSAALGLSANSTAGEWEIGTDWDADGGDNFYVWGGGSGDVRLFINSTGNVGIGVTSPNATLDVVTDSIIPALYGSNSASGNLTLGSTKNATKGKILFGTSAYDEVNNRLGIGTTSPVTGIHIVNNGFRIEREDVSATVTQYSYGGATIISTLNSVKARGTIAAPSAVLADDTLLRLIGKGYGATGFPSSARTWMDFKASENWTDTEQGSYITFNTTLTGGVVQGERMRIDGAGNVGIGTTNPASKLHIGLDTAGQSNYITIGKGYDASSGIQWQRTGVVDSSIYLDASEDLRFETDMTNSLASGNFIFRTNGSEELVRIQPNGNVGIGTTSPSEKVEVASALSGSAGAYTNQPKLRLTQTADLAYNIGDIHEALEFYSKDSSWGEGLQAYVAAATTRLNGQTHADVGLYFGTSNGLTKASYTNPQMVILHNGYVGIGTTSPGYGSLDVIGSGILSERQSTQTANMWSALYARHKTTGDMTDGFGSSLMFQITDSGVTNQTIGAIGAIRDSVDTEGALIFKTGTNGDEEFLRIDHAGNVGIGTTSPGAKLESLSTTEQLRLSYDASNYVSFTTGSAGNLTITPSGGQINIVGDFDISGMAAIGNNGSVSSLKALNVANSFTDTSGGTYGAYILNSAEAASASTAAHHGLYSQARLYTVNGPTSLYGVSAAANLAAAGTVTNLFAFSGSATINNDIAGTVTSLRGLSISTDAEDGTVTNAYSAYIVSPAVDTGSITTAAYGVYIPSGAAPTGVGSVANIYPVYIGADSRTTTTNKYGLYMGTMSGAANNYQLYIAGTAPSYFAGNIGIGTTGPGKLLHVVKNGGDTTALLSVEELGTVGDATVQFRVSESASFFMGIDNSDIDKFKIGTSALGSADLVTIQTDGNVGIGTTGPTRRFVVAGSLTGSYEAQIGSGAVGQSATLDVVATHDSIAFQVWDDNVLTVPRFIVQRAGNVGIGTTGPARKLEVNGSIRMGALITGAGGAVAVYRDVNGDLADSTSSLRYKDNIISMENVLPKIMNLRAVRFNWNDKTSTPGMADFGMISEEVNQILPDLVTYNSDGTPRGLKYEKMGLFALKGLQEQQGQIKTYNLQLTSNNEILKQVQDDIGGITLKTNANITTIQELQNSVDENLAAISNSQFLISNKIQNLNDQIADLQGEASESRLNFENQESRLTTIEDLTAILQAQIDELKRLANIELVAANIETNKTDIEYLKLVLGLDRAENGSVHLLGNLEADEVAAGVFTVKIVDPERKTIGEAMIKAGETEVKVETKAETENAKVFVTPKIVTMEPLAVTKITEGESFKVEIKTPAEKDLQFDWWIVEAK